MSQALLARRCIMCEVMYLPMAERYEVSAYAFPMAVDVQLCQLLANCPNLCQLAGLIQFRDKCTLGWPWPIYWVRTFFFKFCLFSWLVRLFLKKICSQIPDSSKLQQQMKPGKLHWECTKDYLCHEYASLLEKLPLGTCTEALSSWSTHWRG